MAYISKPNKKTLANALNHAELLRERNNDPYAVAHTLLYLSQQNEKLEAIVRAAEEYIRFGEEAGLHSKLLKALEDYDDYLQEVELDEEPKFGLD